MRHKLTVTAVKNFNARGRVADGGGLYLRVTEQGTKSWLFRYRDRTTGKHRYMGLGSLDDVTLAAARDAAHVQRKVLRANGDPLAERERERNTLRANVGKVLTFDEAAKQCHASKAVEFRNAKHSQDWLSSLTMYASPIIGSTPVDQVGLPQVVSVLTPLWNTKTETATRVRGRVESVLAWATVSGYRSGDNPARWKSNLEHVLAKPSKVKKSKHYPAIPWQHVGAFFAELRTREGTGARALEFAILTAARSGEVRLATWDEINLDAKVWTVPANRMKANLKHTVPLSAEAVALLEALPRFEGSPYVFPNTKGGALSDMSISAVCRRMKVDAVPHGFRSSFKDWARSSTAYADEISELCLAHVNSDATRAAYARDELLPKRASLLQAWATYCHTLPLKASVSHIGQSGG